MESNGVEMKPVEVLDFGSKQELKEERPAPLGSSNTSDELISMVLPTLTRPNKRRHIRTDFEDITVSSDAAEAQRRERERLRRLSKLRGSEAVMSGGDVEVADCKQEILTSSDHPEPAAKCSKLPLLAGVKPSTSYVDTDVIELSSDEDSDADARSIDLIQPVPFCLQSLSRK
ncbi:unnamed protein product, partial [Gongylonema pulchrum]|uniref:Uncharacterized protein n=1 Tax=Gongylonema pulchrum TaxID=637853 RepID=A0A183DXV6_9BILA